MRADDANLKRDIRFGGASLLVVNGLIGAGIFALPGPVAQSAGLLSPWLFLIVGLLFLTVVLTFAELASYYDKTGGPVIYATEAFGPFVGFSTGWAIYLSRVTAFAANSVVLGEYVAGFIGGPNADMIQIGVTALVTIGLTWANVVGVKDGVRTMGVFTVLKLLPLVFLILLGLGEVTGEQLLPGPPFAISDLGTTTLALIYAYVGFETLAVTAGETSNPRKTLPKALVGTVMITGLLYFFIVLVYIAVIPESEYATANLTDVGRSLAGPVGATIITLAAIFSIGGNLSGSIISGPRLVFAMAENGSLPAVFGRVHPRFATPHVSVLLYGGIALLLGLTGSFVILAVASSVVRLLGYVVCIAALPTIRRNASDAVRAEAFRLPLGMLIPIAGLLICVWLMAQSKMQSWVVVGGLLAVGGILYAIESLRARSENAS